MVATKVRDHIPGTSTVSGTTVSATLAADVPAGSLLIGVVGFDNGAGNNVPALASVSNFPTISRPAGELNNWRSIGVHNSSTTTTAGGCRSQVIAIRTSVTWPAGMVLTATLTSAVVAKAFVLAEFTGPSTAQIRANSVGATSTTGNPVASIAAGQLVQGDLLIGGSTFEGTTPVIPDPDTTNGAWDGGSQVVVGSGLTGLTSLLQYKVVANTGAQTFAPTGTGDSGAVCGALPGGVYHHTAMNGAGGSGTTAVSTIGISSKTATSRLLEVGDLILLVVVMGNLSLNTPTVASITVPTGETSSWVQLFAVDSDTATAGAGQRLEVWALPVSGNTWTVSNETITVTLSAPVLGLTVAMTEIAGASLPLLDLQTAAAGSGGPNLRTTIPPPIGDLVVGVTAAEGSAGWTDADTTGGVWSAKVGQAGGGSSPDNLYVSASFQTKAITDSVHQTYDPTGGAAFGYSAALFRLPAKVVGAPPSAARAKRWNGSAWADASIKRWDGSQWVTTTIKRWDGAAWV